MMDITRMARWADRPSSGMMNRVHEGHLDTDSIASTAIKNDIS